MQCAYFWPEKNLPRRFFLCKISSSSFCRLAKATAHDLSRAAPASSVGVITEADMLATRERLSKAKHELIDLQTRKSLAASLSADNPFVPLDGEGDRAASGALAPHARGTFMQCRLHGRSVAFTVRCIGPPPSDTMQLRSTLQNEMKSRLPKSCWRQSRRKWASRQRALQPFMQRQPLWLPGLKQLSQSSVR